MKQLKKYNINGEQLFYRFQGYHAYIGAYSKADASRLINEYLEIKSNGFNFAGALSRYGSDGWGIGMEGIELERGIWLQNERFDSNKEIKRII